MATKFGFKHYFKPTPKRVRMFGDSLLGAATIGASLATMNGSPTLGTITFVIGIAGKFISNFFTDEPERECDEPNDPKN